MLTFEVCLLFFHVATMGVLCTCNIALVMSTWDHHIVTYFTVNNSLAPLRIKEDNVKFAQICHHASLGWEKG
jgi:hypothetical protein